MNDTIYQLTIKEDYASAIIEGLRLNDAIEFIPDSIPEWQKTETPRRLQIINEDPTTLIDSDTFFNNIADDAR